MQEFWTLLFKDRRILAPIKNPQEILDIGCGTGLWAIEVADEYSDTQVHGIDISPVQPVYVPPNCSFVLDNFLRGDTFHDQKFDLVQSRNIGSGCPDPQWPRYLQEIWRVTKPGGWIQLIEMDPIRWYDVNEELPKDSPLMIVEDIVERVFREKYEWSPFDVLQKMANHVQDAGFTNIKQYNVKAPVGKWANGYMSWN